MKCFYHSADLDGHCSGAIVKYKFPECEMFPINYGDQFPWDKVEPGEEVYMVDFCLQPFDEMLKLIMKDDSGFVWIDHHASAIQEYVRTKPIHQNFSIARYDTSKAACELTWEYLFPDRPVPLAVKLLSLYDSWTYQGHELEDQVLPFQVRMRVEDLDPKDWKKCGEFWIEMFSTSWNLPFGTSTPSFSANSELAKLVKEGRILLLRYDQEQKRRYVERYAFETEMPPDKATWETAEHGTYGRVWAAKPYLKAITINLGMTNSKVFDSVWRKECQACEGDGEFSRHQEGTTAMEYAICATCNGSGYLEPYDLMITFCRRPDKLWNVSLYSTKEDVDCGAIAKSFGGGGHKGAAGFQCNDLPFEY